MGLALVQTGIALMTLPAVSMSRNNESCRT